MGVLINDLGCRKNWRVILHINRYDTYDKARLLKTMIVCSETNWDI